MGESATPADRLYPPPPPGTAMGIGQESPEHEGVEELIPEDQHRRVQPTPEGLGHFSTTIPEL